MPRGGRVGGRAYRPSRPLWPYYERVHVAAAPPEEDW
jgi:hypothetical protein